MQWVIDTNVNRIVVWICIQESGIHAFTHMYVAVQLQQTTYSVEIKVDKVALLFILQLHHDLVIVALKVGVYVIFRILIHRLSSIFISFFLFNII